MTPKHIFFGILCTIVILFFVVGPKPEHLSMLNEVVMSLSNNKPLPYFQNIPECSCKRLYYYLADDAESTRISTCSDEGTFFERHQRVVTYSMFYNPKDKGRIKLYKEGILMNLQRMREYYPGCTMRVYTDINLEGDYCDYVCNNNDLFWCDIRNTPSLGNMSDMFGPNWRFLTLGDATVEYFLSRDLDSAITQRELAVVNDWLHDGKAIHVMRDKLKAHNIPILAGMWGARNELFDKNEVTKMQNDIINMSQTSKRFYGQDQMILNNIVFYPRKKDIVAYDSYHCQQWSKYTLVKPFPTRRQDNVSDFVGNYNLGRKKYQWLPVCPVECRPSYGKTWKFC